MHLKYLTFLLAIALITLVASCQNGSIGSPSQRENQGQTRTPEVEGPRVVVQSTTPLPAAVATATPSPPTLPDRDDCDEIFGTDYHSPQERDWYLAHCLPTPAPTAPPPAPPAIPGPDVQGERWIRVDIATQTATAMIGDQALYTALATTGVDGWDTPTGTWNIVYRVENETMTSASIGAEEYYVLEDVLYTQYFTTVGHALHLNYWRSDDYFGNERSSHGCVGMRLPDAEFFWRFASVGTRVTVQ